VNRQNDLVGCDPARGLGYTYTAASQRETVWGAYQPAVGFQLLETPRGAGLTAFPRVWKGSSEPSVAEDALNLLRGLEIDGTEMEDPTTGEPTRCTASGDR